MTIEEIQRTLGKFYFQVGRICSETNDFRPQADEPNRVIRNAAIATRSHGIVWRGDLELTYEGHELECAAREVGENFYVVEAAAANADDGSNSMDLIKQSVWWTYIAESDADHFADIDDCFGPSPAGQKPAELLFDPPGDNWAGKLIFADSGDRPDWQQELSTHRGKRVVPRLYHQSGPYKIVWFDHGKAVLYPDYCVIRCRFGKVKFRHYPNKAAICVQKDGQAVALLWPSPVPNPETASKGLHELAMQRWLRVGEMETYCGLRDLITAELRPAMYTRDARRVYTAAARILYLLQGGSRPTDARLRGCIEWQRCPGIEVKDGAYVFQGSRLPVGCLFRNLAEGEDLESFAAQWSSINRQQLAEVLTYVADSMDF